MTALKKYEKLSNKNSQFILLPAEDELVKQIYKESLYRHTVSIF